MAAPAPADLSPAQAAEALMRRSEAAWNAHDMDAFTAPMTPDVHWVNTVGMHWRGLDEVRRAHVAFHAGMFKDTPMEVQEIESVTPLGADAAVAVVRIGMAAFDTPTGPRPPSRNRLTLGIVRTPEGWRIAHGANVPIFEEAQAHDPVRR